MAMYATITTGERARVCDGNCGKVIQGKEQEYFFRIAVRNCGKNYCSACLRRKAAELDRLNNEKAQKHGHSLIGTAV